MTRRSRPFTTARVICVTLSLIVSPWIASAVHAHAVSTSFFQITASTPSTDPVDIRLDVAVLDLQQSINLDANDDGDLTWGELNLEREAIARYALERVAVSRAGAQCDVRFKQLRLVAHVGEPYVALDAIGACTRSGLLAVGSTLFQREDTAHRTLLQLTTRGGSSTGLVSAGSPPWQQTAKPNWLETLVQFFGQGVFHVWTGYDHIAFLLLLLLPSVRFGATRSTAIDVLKLVTAFTIAHSITLGAATLRIVTLPERWVELTIAVSIVIAGLLNLIPRAARYRLPTAFGFGLVHGFGFANALAGLGLAGTALVPALAGFNVGVEIGQLAIVILAIPALLWLIRQAPLSRRLVPAMSIGVACLGAYWVLQRAT